MIALESSVVSVLWDSAEHRYCALAAEPAQYFISALLLRSLVNRP
jgi:hypothetical protein